MPKFIINCQIKNKKVYASKTEMFSILPVFIKHFRSFLLTLKKTIEKTENVSIKVLTRYNLLVKVTRVKIDGALLLHEKSSHTKF